MSEYVEARSRGQERRSLHKLVIEASEKGEVAVSKVFEAQHHAPEKSHFALDQGHELLQYISECLQMDPDTGELFSGPEFGHALLGEEHSEESPTAEGESETGEEY